MKRDNHSFKLTDVLFSCAVLHSLNRYISLNAGQGASPSAHALAPSRRLQALLSMARLGYRHCK